MKRKWIYRKVAIVLTIIISLSSIVWLPAYSADGYNPTAYSGSGTVVDPYKISNANELASLADTVNRYNGWFNTQSKYYILTNDIFLNDVSDSDWTKNAKEWIYGTADSIEQSSFKGNLDGNGFVIHGLYIKESAKKYNGLFPGIMGGATVKNIGFEDCYIDASGTPNSEVGCISGGQHIWPTDLTITISTSYIGSGVNLNGGISGGFVGHIVRKTIITDCYSKGENNNSSVKGSFIGTVDKNISLEINSSYSTSQMNITGVKEGEGDVSFIGSYSTLESKTGLAKITLDKLTGKDVPEKIDMLDFENVWEAREDETPIISIFNKDKKPIECWDGTVSESLSLQNKNEPNSESNPYLISNGSDLAYLAKTVNGSGETTKDKYYKLTDDIYLNDVSKSDWKSNPNKWENGITKKDIEKSSDQANIKKTSFYGCLDGNGKVIKGIYETNNAIASSAGLFPSLGGNAEIKNLGFEDSYIKISRNVGVIAGITTAQSGSETIKISNCYVANSVNLIQTSDKSSYAGGFIGRINHSVSVDNCYSSAVISKSEWQRIGGIIGGAWDVGFSVSFSNCYNTQSNEYAVETGGNFFIYEGTVSGSVTFSNCYTTGKTKNELGLKQVSLENMTGADAKKYMPNLGYSATDKFYIINGKTPQLTSFRKLVPDTAAPTMTGEIQKTAASSEAIQISWKPAEDNITAMEHMQYEIFISDSEITEENINSARLIGSIVCETTFVIDGLELGKSYYFAVMAKDGSENTVTAFSSNPFATEESVNDIWDGSIAKMFDGGDGTQENPYRIANAEQLAHLVDVVNNQPADTTKDKFYEITDDIYLNDISFTNWKKNNPREWTVGISSSTVAKGFAGTLNGNFHIINGLYINESGGNFNGLFSSLDGTATVKNLGIQNSYISSYEYRDTVSSGSMSGAIAGTLSKINYGGGETVALIEKCFSDETVFVHGTYCSGGIVGSILMSGSNVKFLNCYSGAELEQENFAGSIIGDAWDPTYTINLENCYGTQSGVTLVGHTGTIPTYLNCYSNVSEKEGITKVYVFQMRGEDAKKIMSALDFENTWGLSESATPYLLDFKNSSYGVDFPLITVSFDTNGGDEIKPLSAYTGAKLNLPTPVKEGYVFEGWYVYKELDIKYPLDTFPGYDMTLFAKWRDIAVLRQDFESYSYTLTDFEGLGKDYEHFRPGIVGYDPTFVRGGSKSLHRIGAINEQSSFQLFNDDADKNLETGKNYKISLWIYLNSSNNANGQISIISTDNLDIAEKANSMMNIKGFSELMVGKWQEVTAEFVAGGKYLSVLTSGLADLYIDDVTIIPVSGNAKTMQLNPPTIKRENTSDTSATNQTQKEIQIVTKQIPEKTTKTVTQTVSPDYLWLYLSIGFSAAGLLVGVAFVTVLIVKKKKASKTQGENVQM